MTKSTPPGDAPQAQLLDQALDRNQERRRARRARLKALEAERENLTRAGNPEAAEAPAAEAPPEAKPRKKGGAKPAGTAAPADTAESGTEIERLNRQVRSLTAALEKARAGIVRREERLAALAAERDALAAKRNAMLASRSWRITAPLRRLLGQR